MSCILFQGCIQGNNTNNNTSDAPIDLKLNFKPGVKYTYLNETTDTMGVPGMNKEMSINTNIILANTYSITPVGNTKKIDFSFDQVIIKSPAGEYNSDDTFGGLKVLNGLKKQMHVHRSAVLSDKGDITDIKTDAIKDAANLDAFSSISMFNDDAIKSSLKYYFDIYPGKLIKLGERWTKNMVFNIASVNTTIPVEFRLITADNGIAHIEMNSEIKNISDSTSHSIMHFMNMKGTLSGTMDMDISSGLITDYTQTTHLVGSMNINTQELPATIVSNIHVTGKELK